MSAAAAQSPNPLWHIARAFIVTFFNLFGAPEQIAAQHTFTAKTYNLILPWLRAGEALIRRLLLIEAAALERKVGARASSPHRKRNRQRIEFFAERPQEWRVSFRCFPRDATASVGPSPSKAKRNAERFHSAWPIAERAEAMLRVFNNPAPYAARLARRLYTRPQRVKDLAHYPGGAPDLIGHEDFAKTRDPVIAAEKHFDSG